MLRFFFVALFFTGISDSVYSQEVRSLIVTKVTRQDAVHDELSDYGKRAPNKYKGPANLLLTFYQRYLGVVIAADCMYHPSCSRYSRVAVSKFGMLKGILLTGDRLSRCSGIAANDIPDYKFKEEGHVEDLP